MSRGGGDSIARKNPYEVHRMKYNEYIAYVDAAKKNDYCIPAELHDIIDAVSRSDFSKLLKLSGLNASALSRSLNIPARTGQGWASGTRTPPEYVIQLIGYAIISEYEKEND